MNSKASNKKLNSNDILNQRVSGGFPKRVDTTAQIMPSKQKMVPMVVTLDELRASNVLERLKKNESYENLKSSIKERGLDNPPVITSVPGLDGYVISDGGNTRLQILKELYAETKDPKFLTINCFFKPWQGELNSVIGHLAENGLRNDYTFIEKALGVEKSKRLYEQELGETLSSRALSEKLKAGGYPVSYVTVNKMLRTVEQLYEYIPEILKQGLSSNQIDLIFSLKEVSKKIFYDKNNFRFENDKFENEFNLILTEFDLNPESFSYVSLEKKIIGYFSDLFQISDDVFYSELYGKKKSIELNGVVKQSDIKNDEIVQKEQSQQIVEKEEQNTSPAIISELEKVNKKSITKNLTILEQEAVPVFDIWKSPKKVNSDELLEEIQGLLLDVFNESGIHSRCMIKIIDINHKRNYIELEPLSEEDKKNRAKLEIYEFISSLISTTSNNKKLNIHNIIYKFNDFIVIKIFRIIRLRRIFNSI